MTKLIPCLVLAFAVSGAVLAETPDAANTGKNERDRSGQTMTPEDQSNTPSDLKITQAIRKALMNDSDLSLTAKNIKIITAENQVTLRGPVKSAEEKSKIENIAKSAASGTTITNNLEIESH